VDIHPGLLVARGELDLAVQTRGQVWDYAATSLIVEEAGGRFGMLDGQAQPTPGPALFARSGALHTVALQVLNTNPDGSATPLSGGRRGGDVPG
jgi:histidinol-phosphatase